MKVVFLILFVTILIEARSGKRGAVGHNSKSAKRVDPYYNPNYLRGFEILPKPIKMLDAKAPGASITPQIKAE
ncbi:hypothetical protein GE061_008026 [Apolygus lucorum]|uniref:Uncharacterized protein n=1 Tax=Apolygus lucorum TaxID=248454 RepID=A0A8S9WQ82_APOLU|nr:hypothetical protein GE061_008026 [Apolygus lucorum]